MTVFCAHTMKRMSSKLPYQIMADTSNDELLLDGRIRHLTATSQYRAHRKQVRSSVNALIFGNISISCAKEYIIAAIC